MRAEAAYVPVRIISDGSGQRIETLEIRGQEQPQVVRARRSLLEILPQWRNALTPTLGKLAVALPIFLRASRLAARELWEWLGVGARLLARILASGAQLVLVVLATVREHLVRELPTVWPRLRPGLFTFCRLVLALTRHLARAAASSIAAVVALGRRLRQSAAHDQDDIALASTFPGYRYRPRYVRGHLGWDSTVAIPLIASAGVIVLAVLVYTSKMPDFFEGMQLSETPSLTNRTLDEAIDAARTQGLEVAVSSVQPTEDLPKDMVISQVPGPGSQIRRGGLVKLTISSGLRPPDVVGKPLEQARTLLVRQGWMAAPEIETRLANDSVPDMVIEQKPSVDEVAPSKGAVKLTIGIRNLAHGKNVRTSVGGPAPEAVDGRDQTVAWPPSKTPSWVEVDFGAPITIAAVSLHLAAERLGPATIELWAWSVDNRFFPLHLINQAAEDNSVLNIRLGQPAMNVARLRVVTTSAQSVIGWREISVLDR